MAVTSDWYPAALWRRCNGEGIAFSCLGMPSFPLDPGKHAGATMASRTRFKPRPNLAFHRGMLATGKSERRTLVQSVGACGLRQPLQLLAMALVISGRNSTYSVLAPTFIERALSTAATTITRTTSPRCSPPSKPPSCSE